LVREGGLNGGHQVGETLAHPGPRLDHEMMMVDNSIRHRLGHVELLRPDFIVAKSPGNGATRPQDRRIGHLQNTVNFVGFSQGFASELVPSGPMTPGTGVMTPGGYCTRYGVWTDRFVQGCPGPGVGRAVWDIYFSRSCFQ